MPTFEEATEALGAGRHEAAIAAFAARTLADPSDAPSRTNHAIALANAGRFAQAAPMFERFIEELGPASLVTVGLLFLLGTCRHENGDARGSLEAMTEFLDRSNEWHPLYWDGVHHVAFAWERLGAKLAARGLYAQVQWQRVLEQRLDGMALLRPPLAGPWTRRKIIETSFRILGRKGRARRARRCEWEVE